MNIATNIASNNEDSEDIHNSDESGLAEIQQAMDEIEKLKNQGEVSEDEIHEEELEDIENSDEKPATPKKEKKEDKLWKIKKDKYRALAEKDILAQENLKLKQMLNESLNSGTYHYGKSAYFDLERAKEHKKRAIEEGDVDALIDSDIALNKALNTVNDLEKWAHTEEHKKNYSQEQNYQSKTAFNETEHEIATDWLDNHNYLQPSSHNYNPQLANQVAGFINYLDANLDKNGQRDAYFTEQYFETIDNYINELKTESKKSPKNSGTQPYVGGVRNSYSSGGSTKSSSQMILSADEKRICANLGMNEKEWIKYKLEDLKKGK